MKRYLDRITTSKMFLGVIAALLLYALAGFALAPALLERYLPRYAEEQLGSQVTVGDVRINPFLLRLEVKGFRLEYPPGQPLVRLASSWSTSSCPASSAGRGPSRTCRSTGWTSTSRFSATEDSTSPHSWTAWPSATWPFPRASGPSTVALAARPARDGKLTFSDLSGQTPLTTTFVPINLEVLNLATLPDRHGRYAITAAVPDGGTITWQGDVSPCSPRRPRASWR